MIRGAPPLAPRLDRPPPATLPPGARTVLWLSGGWWPAGGTLAALSLTTGAPSAAGAAGAAGAPGGTGGWPATAFAHPRSDLAAAGAPLRSGFWGAVPVRMPPAAGDGAVVTLTGRLADGRQISAELGTITAAPPEADAVALTAVPESGAAAPIAVALATYDPDPVLLVRQLASLRAQTDRSWICVVSDDDSPPAGWAAVRAAVGDDPRFLLTRAPARLGFYRNFERAIRIAARAGDLVALSDQDDVWHPDKLAALRAAIGGRPLAYCDMRLVEPGGRVLAGTLWRGRANNRSDLAAMLAANSVTGAAILMPRATALAALPFPDHPGFAFHDHWLALVGLARGELAYVDRALYDYVQHPGAVFGDVTHGASRRRSRWRQASPRHAWGGARAAYLEGWVPREVQARVLLERLGDAIAPEPRAALERFLAAPRSPRAAAAFALHPFRAGTRRATLGAEGELLAGAGWLAAARLLARAPAGRAGDRLARYADAAPPPPGTFSQARLRRWRASLAR